MTPATRRSPVRAIWAAGLAVVMGAVGVLLALALFEGTQNARTPDVRPPAVQPGPPIPR